MTIKPWKILDTTYLHPGIRVDKCQLPNGQIITPHILDYADEIMIFALTRNDEVVLIKQYRHGIQEVILELPGGSVDDGESPRDAAKRELFEETGYSSDMLVEVGQCSPNPAIYMNRIYSFLALDVEQTGQQSADDVDAIEVVLMPLDEVIGKAGSGALINSLNISTLFFVLEHLHRIS